MNEFDVIHLGQIDYEALVVQSFPRVMIDSVLDDFVRLNIPIVFNHFLEFVCRLSF